MNKAENQAPDNLDFVDNPAIAGRLDAYLSVTVDVEKVLRSWRVSLFSYEWMLPDGRLKSAADLPEKEQPKRREIEQRVAEGAPLEKPVLGIGMLENIEIGIGRATFLTLASMGLNRIPVHIPRTHKDDFAAYLD